jgi:hypothetical protein
MADANQYGTEVRVRKQSNEYVFEVASASPDVAPIVMMLTPQMVDEMTTLISSEQQPWTYIRGNVTYSIAPNKTSGLKLSISVAGNETSSEPTIVSWVSSTFSTQSLIAAIKEAV